MTEDELFPLDPEKIYYSMDELTLDTEEGPVTLKLGAWLNVDPVRIHKMIVREKVLQVDNFWRHSLSLLRMFQWNRILSLS